MAKRKMSALVLSGLLTCCSPASKLPGTYIASDDTGGFMFQVTSVKDNAVAGTLTVVTPDGHGLVNAVTRPVSGRLEGKALNMMVENGLGGSVVTGTIVPAGIDLTFFTNGGSQKLSLSRHNAEDFASVENDIRSKAANLKQAELQSVVTEARGKALSAAQDQVDQVVATLNTRSQAVADFTAQVGTVSTIYAQASRKASLLSNAEITSARQFGSDDYRTSQIAQDRQSNSNNVETCHQSVHDSVVRFDQTINDHAREVSATLGLCAQNPGLDCSSLRSAWSVYLSRAADLRKASEVENSAYARVQGHL